jgi:tripartite-type tricarboxylate transporter receptor subunit TctC
MKKCFWRAWILLSIPGLSFSGFAQAAYPDRPITLICNFAAGGSSDVGARALAESAEKILGQPIVVLNKVGASGTLGVGAVAAAKPDGYTIGVTSYSPLVLAPHMFDIPYNPLKDFDYILCYAKVMYGPCVRADSQFKTLKDLVQYAKANPGKVKYSAAGLAVPNHFGMVMLSKAEGGIKWELVVFKGNIEAVAACLGGHVDVVSQNPADVVPYIQSGKLRLLASLCETRWKWVPDVPTVRELGYKFGIESYYALGAPKGVPKLILEKLTSSFKKATEAPRFLEVMDKIYVPVDYRSGEEYQRMVEKGYKEMGDLIMELGLDKSQQKK